MGVEASEHDSDHHEARDGSHQARERRSWKVMSVAVVLSVVAAGFAAFGVVRFLSHARAPSGPNR
jgi:hypothetical protein